VDLRPNTPSSPLPISGPDDLPPRPVPPLEGSPRARAVIQCFVFAVLFFIISQVFGLLLSILPNLLLVSALAVFLGSLVATTVTLRMFSPPHPLLSIGLQWDHRHRNNLLLGILLGAVFGAAVTIAPVLIGKASWGPAETPFSPSALLVFFVVMLFGAIGEEVLFRGLIFQRLTEAFGPWVGITITSLLFGWAHSQNLSVTWLAIANTVLWGAVFGFARLRSNDLWLPIGLHAGWNWILPLLGVQLSGFTLEVTGIRLRSEDPLWSGGAYGPEAGVFTTAAMPLIVFLLLRVWQNRNAQEQ
jgi:membrane protease YdiL (CAAX protease family)